MRRNRNLLLGLAATFATGAAIHPASSAALEVLVTNDDGIGAEGISELVEHLSENPELELHVIAPAANQSGTGDRFSREAFPVTPGETAGGFPGLAVQGFPADTVFFGVVFELPPIEPDLIVSGINEGQNVAELVNISGTVGAALTGARMGIPGFAVSQGLAGEISYTEAAAYTAGLVEEFRTNASFRRLLQATPVSPNAQIVNINFPTCTTGSLRGVRAVRLGRTATVVDYEALPNNEYQPVVANVPIGSNDCTSTLPDPQTDLEAMNNGFASVTPLSADLTDDALLQRIARFLEPEQEVASRCVPRTGDSDVDGRAPVRSCTTRLPRTD